MGLGSHQNEYSQGLFETSATQKEVLGKMRILADGRKFRYCLNGATALAAGTLVSGATATANHINRSVAAAAIGDYEVTVTVGATAVTADQYKHGYLQINDGTGEGHQYFIESNTACDASGDTVVRLVEPIRVALVASATTEASLIPNPFYGVVVSATAENLCCGAATKVIPANHYFWAQTGGVACILAQSTGAVGTWAIVGSTDGACNVVATSVDIDVPSIGWMFSTAHVATEYKPVFLTID